jgi:hypothetical protein
LIKDRDNPSKGCICSMGELIYLLGRIDRAPVLDL